MEDDSNEYYYEQIRYPRHVDVAGDKSIIVFGFGTTLQTEQMTIKETSFGDIIPYGIWSRVPYRKTNVYCPITRTSVLSFSWTCRHRFLIATYDSSAEASKACKLYNSNFNDGRWATRAFSCVLRKIKNLAIWNRNLKSIHGKSRRGGKESVRESRVAPSRRLTVLAHNRA
jgi:hypothetical protein